QRLERPHPIEEQYAVEVIGLVLDDTRREIVRAQFHPVPFAIHRPDANLPRARHTTADVGDAQASLPVLDDVAANDGDFGIDDDDRCDLLTLIGRIKRGHENADALVHLWRGEAHAVILDHGLDHVVDEPLNGDALDFALVE